MSRINVMSARDLKGLLRILQKGPFPMQVEVHKDVKVVSPNLRAVYWLWIREIASNVPGQFSENELHEWFKGRFNLDSVATANREDMMAYMANIRSYAFDDMDIDLGYVWEVKE